MWAIILDVVTLLIDAISGWLPVHESLGLVADVNGWLEGIVGLILMFTVQVIDARVLFGTMIIMLLLEWIRLGFATWALLKKIWP